jgi:hypothetical protein
VLAAGGKHAVDAAVAAAAAVVAAKASSSTGVAPAHPEPTSPADTVKQAEKWARQSAAGMDSDDGSTDTEGGQGGALCSGEGRACMVPDTAQ